MNSKFVRSYSNLSLLLVGVLFLFGCQAGSRRKLDKLPVRHINERVSYFIDNEGEIVIESVESDIFYMFSEGLAAVDGNGLTRYINEKGKVVIENSDFSSGSFFSDGLARVQTANNNGYAFIDKNGSFAIEGPFSDATDFSEGLAFVSYSDDYNHSSGSTQGFINRKGAMVIPLEGAFSKRGFSDGMAAIYDWNEYPIGYVDTNGNLTRVTGVSEIHDFHEGLAAASFSPEGGYYKYIDKNGAVSFDESFAWAGAFSQGLACVAKSGRWNGNLGRRDLFYFFIDKNGLRVTEETFEDCTHFHENGLAGVKKDGKFGYIDKQGNYVVPLTEDYKFASTLPYYFEWSNREENPMYSGRAMPLDSVTEGILTYIDGEGNLIYSK